MKKSLKESKGWRLKTGLLWGHYVAAKLNLKIVEMPGWRIRDFVQEYQLRQKLRQMAKFRNRLVHLYGEIDDVFVYVFMTSDIEDIKRFRKIIIRKYAS